MTAKQILNAWMAVFPSPECREQQEVVDATKAWLAGDHKELSPEQWETVRWALEYASKYRLGSATAMSRKAEKLREVLS